MHLHIYMKQLLSRFPCVGQCAHVRTETYIHALACSHLEWTCCMPRPHAHMYTWAHPLRQQAFLHRALQLLRSTLLCLPGLPPSMYSGVHSQVLHRARHRLPCSLASACCAAFRQQRGRSLAGQSSVQPSQRALQDPAAPVRWSCQCALRYQTALAGTCTGLPV